MQQENSWRYVRTGDGYSCTAVDKGRRLMDTPGQTNLASDTYSSYTGVYKYSPESLRHSTAMPPLPRSQAAVPEATTATGSLILYTTTRRTPSVCVAELGTGSCDMESPDGRDTIRAMTTLVGSVFIVALVDSQVSWALREVVSLGRAGASRRSRRQNLLHSHRQPCLRQNRRMAVSQFIIILCDWRRSATLWRRGE